MASKKRYVVTHRAPTAKGKAGAEKTESDVAPLMPKDRIVRRLKSGHAVMELTPAEAAELTRNDSVIGLEEDQDLQILMPMPALGFRIEEGIARSLDFQVLAGDTQKPVEDVTIFAVGNRATYRAETGRDGKASVKVFENELRHIILSPRANYWSKVTAAPAFGEMTAVGLDVLQPPGPKAWPLELLGVSPGRMVATGSGVKVAVIDGGVAKHPDLVVKGGVNCLDEENPTDFQRDDDGHGTHCAGIIAGRSMSAGATGVAPDVDLYSVKVFPRGKLSDLLEGIQWAVDNRMDVISMSLAMTQSSAALAEVVGAAIQRGIICVAAAGNDGGAVRYPAMIEGVIAVSAIGHLTTFPADSGHALRVSSLANPETGLFFGNFSSVGPEIGFCSPGVAVISTVPQGYAAWDGTSVACPFVAGAAALALSAYPQLRTGDLNQMLSVREILSVSARDLRLPVELQGAGLVNAAPLQSAAAKQKDAAQRLKSMRGKHQETLAELGADLAKACRQIEDMLTSTG
ncbi:MAG TPA: S8 family serine peptidase [Nitrospiraceae bacterium]|nr:S8 family serine peptidase [Nitrospiraceae bacterium]